MASGITLFCSNGERGRQKFFFFYSIVSREKKKVKKKKRRESFETYSRIPTLLVGRNVTTQAPSSNNNTSSNNTSNNNTSNNNTSSNNSRTQRHKKFVAFNMKQ